METKKFKKIFTICIIFFLGSNALAAEWPEENSIIYGSLLVVAANNHPDNAVAILGTSIDTPMSEGELRDIVLELSKTGNLIRTELAEAGLLTDVCTGDPTDEEVVFALDKTDKLTEELWLKHYQNAFTKMSSRNIALIHESMSNMKRNITYGRASQYPNYRVFLERMCNARGTQQ